MIVFRLFRGAETEIELVVGTSGGSNSVAVALRFPLLLLDIGEVGDSSKRVVDVFGARGVLGPLIKSET